MGSGGLHRHQSIQKRLKREFHLATSVNGGVNVGGVTSLAFVTWLPRDPEKLAAYVGLVEATQVRFMSSVPHKAHIQPKDLRPRRANQLEPHISASQPN